MSSTTRYDVARYQKITTFAESVAGTRHGLALGAPTTTASRLLNRRTLHRPIRAEHTAVACLRVQQKMTVGTFVKINACIGRHRLTRLRTAIGARQSALEDKRRVYRHEGGSPFRWQTSSISKTVANTKPRNPTRCCGSRRTPAAMFAPRIPTRTAHPCHTVGGPQPHPRRFAGNQ